MVQSRLLMTYDDKNTNRHTQPAPAQRSQDKSIPGKQTRSGQLPRREKSVPVAHVQRQTAAHAENGMNEDWSRVAFRPDLYGTPEQKTPPRPISADRSVQRQTNHATETHGTNVTPVQGKFTVGSDTYTKKGAKNTKQLVVDVSNKLEADGIGLGWGWKGKLTQWAGDDSFSQDFADLDKLIEALAQEYPAKKANSRKRKLDEQDTNISNLTKDVEEPAKKRAKMLANNSEKAFEKLRTDVEGTKEFEDTLDELKALPPAEMSSSTDVTTSNPFIFLGAIHKGGSNDELERMDFNLQGTEFQTHGYESQGKRDVAPKGEYETSKGDKKPFLPVNYNTMKVGNGIGTYAQHQESTDSLANDHVRVLDTLEKYRLPQQAFGTSVKRNMFHQGLFNTQQAFGQNHPHSNVEFLGATSGSGLNSEQRERMREQQSISNVNILNSAVASHPDTEIGYETQDKKPRTTPRELNEALVRYENVEKGEKDERKLAKRHLRRKMKRAMASTEKLENINSDDEVSSDEESSDGES